MIDKYLSKKYLSRACFYTCVFLLGVGSEWYVYSIKNVSSVSSGPIRANLSQYQFINPLLYSDRKKSDDAPYKTLASSLQIYIASVKNSSMSQSISVYFRDMNVGRWTGVDEDKLYKPSSMLKVLAMMSVLKLAEHDPGVLSQKMLFRRSYHSKDYLKEDKNLSYDSYSIQELISVMIKNSNNDAFRTLVSDPRINNEFLDLYMMFRLPHEGLIDPSLDYMSPHSYSAIFRILYNSSLFPWGLSEKVLELLSETTFTCGIVAGVPSDIKVSHKFGENTNELHDCGIVYYPQRPYLLCVMTKGKSISDLSGIIANISKIAWTFMKTTYPTN
jgi:beta-lactamase class A